MKKKIEQVVISAVETINETLRGDKAPIHEGLSCTLYGEGSSLDSISLVSLISLVEQGIEDEFDSPIILASEKAMSMRNSPFQSVGRLVDYIEGLLEEGNE